MKFSTIASLLLTAGLSLAAQAKNNLTLEDVMHFQSITEQVLDPQGRILAYSTAPDRGDSQGFVKRLADGQQYLVAGGSEPSVSNDGRYSVFTVKPSLLSTEQASAKARKKLKAGLALIDNQSGEIQHFERVKSHAFSENGKYLALWFDEAETKEAKTDTEDKTHSATVSAKEALSPKKTAKDDAGTQFTVVNLDSGKSLQFDYITDWRFSYDSRYLTLAQNDSATALHKLLLVRLDSFNQAELVSSKTEQIGAVALSRDAKHLAYTAGNALVVAAERPYRLALYSLDTGKFSTVQEATKDTDGWLLNRYSQLQFSADGQRLFFGRVPQISQQFHLPKVENEADLYNEQLITEQRGLNIWHGDDPLIKPNEIKQYPKELKRTYLAVLHVQSGSVVQLADTQVPDVTLSEHKRFLLASSDIPYRKMITWAGFYRDFYLVDMNTGHKTMVLTQQPSDSEPRYSPNGQYLAWYQQGQIFLYDIAEGRKLSLTASIKTPFANEDHDYPSVAPGYGFGPWLADDSAILVYDKYDIWQFDTTSHNGFMLTDGEGRKQHISFRVEATPQPDKAFQPTIADGAAILLQGYSERTKADAFYRAQIAKAGVTSLLNAPAKLQVLARANNAHKMVFSQQRYDLFPDLYTADVLEPAKAIRQTELDQQRQNLPWGKAELVHWRDGDGRLLDGVVIKPPHYQKGKRYPVMVYYYRFMSDRLFAFPDMKINHRPNFAWYSADDYVIFLPDIRFEIGYPGSSSVKALTAGVQKLIELGIADPDAIGLQGHSWSGYQTAFDITQTNIFKAAVAGAPVSNMTSAYSGIRLGTGLARQFQYEAGQSRIGESLMQAPQKYIENSPVFYVDRIHTPLLIMFGDRDDAVPWEQGIELYLAMRRAGKEVIMLQYNDEPHHLKKYPNKLDYTIRMKQFFDHYLKGRQAPEWMMHGEPYREPAKEE
ncbi:prolyl oligopeptidase family serine peptidase [Shewanella sp. A32]|uniref:prolyl oligopeptidase family serine peptidase n=1 Tax=Shewanella sp. A32 TaxID=3031327 RepID=UPI0023BA1419|nr:prolyl oligopeptidase family serine peptidase [Shewanella sp. A32]MDF0534523.1 prolyl oligopeptidase family serine peptidase [Shewanella sp. A32]